jgi:hypothetical protein
MPAENYGKEECTQKRIRCDVLYLWLGRATTLGMALRRAFNLLTIDQIWICSRQVRILGPVSI